MNANDIFGLHQLVYWAAIVITIFTTTLTIGRLWRRRENARWTVGYFVVFFLGLPLVILGYWDAGTYIGLFFAVGLSGAIKVGCEDHKASTEAQQLRSSDDSPNP